MEIGAFFILAIFLAVVIVLGGGVYLITAYFRHQKLHPEEDKLDDDPSERRQHRPEHVKTGRAQRARFVASKRS